MTAHPRSVVFGLLLVSLLGLPLKSQPSAEKSPGLLFYLSGDHGTTADIAAGDTAKPTFEFQITPITDGAKGGALSCSDVERLAYGAPGNIYAQRGTLSFFWRSRYPVGATPFPIFRVGYADHSSWDMVFLRIDYNGHGFDAFVTDASLSRTRVSVDMPSFPGPKEWIHLALSWDETQGIRFYVNGVLAAKKQTQAIYYAGLNQFGPHSRIIAPWQVQSDFNFVRGGDIDEVRIYDRMLTDANMATLSKGIAPSDIPALARDLAQPRWRDEWWFRNGWNRPDDPPAYLQGEYVTIRKVEIHDAYDFKRWWWKATDGIRETTWPGVYNRSRLPGRNDYFQLPDWDCYSMSGKSITFTLPNEPWNHLEISGAAYGTMNLVKEGPPGEESIEAPLFDRPKGQERTFHRLAQARTGGKIRFDNLEQEQPIGELSAYYVSEGREPAGAKTVAYRLAAGAEEDPALQDLVRFIDGRYAPDERSMLEGRPISAPTPPRANAPGNPLSLPIVHVLIPCDSAVPGYQLDQVDGGMDGIAIDLPALQVRPTHGGLFPINIQVKDPLWPMRDMLDFTFSVRPGEKKTLWLDLRDRILPKGKGLYITLSGAGADFGSASLLGATVRVIFKSRKDALPEHEIDRFTQAKDTYAMLVEEHPFGPRYDTWNRFQADITDLLRVDPDHVPGRNYWAVAMANATSRLEWTKGLPDWSRPAFTQPVPPAGVPLWAFRQVEALKHVKYFVNWWIDHRQVENGEFGGGISDDTDLTNTWPGVGLMGCDPDKLGKSLRLQIEAVYRQGMLTNGLCSIQADELHSYEEGLNSLGQNLILNFGSPRMMERAMESARGIEWLTGVNPNGHRLFRSSYYNGLKMATDEPWGYTKAYSYLVLQPTQLLVDYNGNPQAKKVLLELADGMLAHRHKDASGKYVLPTAVRFQDDHETVATRGYFQWPLFWSAYKWTSERKYLDPIFDGGTTYIAEVNANLLDLLDLRSSYGPQILKHERGRPTEGRVYDARGPGNHPDRVTGNEHFVWQLTGDKRQLEALYGQQIEDMVLGEYINTEGSLWIDRVSVPYTELQRARLGGIALVRNGCFPGHVVSWKFHAPATELSTAILVPSSTRTHVKVIAYNLSTSPVHTAMTGWDVDPGTWTLTQGVDGSGNDTATQDLTTKTVAFGRSESLELTLPPRAATVLELTLVKAGKPYWDRPDLGIDREDIEVHGREIKVTIHNIGAVASAPTTLAVRGPDGKVLGVEQVPSIAAPLDLYPKTFALRTTLPAGRAPEGCTIEIDPDHALDEITRTNNQVTL